MSNHENTKKVVTQRQSVHVVFFSCPDCGEETEHIQLCPDCSKPMRVIDVVEKFGDDADAFLKKVQEKIENGTFKKDDLIAVDEEEQPNVIVLADDDSLDDGAVVDDGVDTLGDIFPDDEDDEKVTSSAPEGLTDLDDIVAELDKEEDDDFPLVDDLGDEGLPEL
ncbi:hypothetical protein CVU76_01280 [Candidatus Dojkabacteria bacterium HGW-Dojkabacteria-1]|uniref:Uncharacterized protein n=1 Tax=Candidatus Dojkabacteria bacterium HGW-Dojkabacteria-1 TaxID=2013761 RepID=A0A2N2F357_9BACT|nr:MAG: hypothetical protein CVU76_01280 [Candidatus Dojkabacteria bacterium HGW-Dojkabacteria-1]